MQIVFSLVTMLLMVPHTNFNNTCVDCKCKVALKSRLLCVFVKLHRNSDKGVEIAYLGTRTGLSRINLFVAPDELTNQ